MKLIAVSFIIIIILFVSSVSIYDSLPAKIITHWDINGNANGYMSKFWGLFLLPLISIGILALFLVIPLIDPLKRNIKKFRNYYDLFVVFVMGFLLYIHIITLLINLGFNLNINLLIFPAIGILIFFIGFILEKVKRNWFIGIRTPWTISSDYVWKKTHKLGALLFKISGLIIIFGAFLPRKYAFFIILVPIIASVIILTIYSYLVYRKEKK